jgi:hypothetical protein
MSFMEYTVALRALFRQMSAGALKKVALLSSVKHPCIHFFAACVANEAPRKHNKVKKRAVEKGTRRVKRRRGPNKRPSRGNKNAIKEDL